MSMTTLDYMEFHNASGSEIHRTRPRVSFSYREMKSSEKNRKNSPHDPYDSSSSEILNSTVKSLGKRIKRKKPVGIAQRSWNPPSPVLTSDSDTATMFPVKRRKKYGKKWTSTSNSDTSLRQKHSKGQKSMHTSPEPLERSNSESEDNVINEKLAPSDEIISETCDITASKIDNRKRRLRQSGVDSIELFRHKEALNEQTSLTPELRRENQLLLQVKQNLESENERLNGKRQHHIHNAEGLQSKPENGKRRNVERLAEKPCNRITEQVHSSIKTKPIKTSSSEIAVSCKGSLKAEPGIYEKKPMKVSAPQHMICCRTLSAEFTVYELLTPLSSDHKDERSHLTAKSSTSFKTTTQITKSSLNQSTDINSSQVISHIDEDQRLIEDSSGDVSMMLRLKSEIQERIDKFKQMELKNIKTLQHQVRTMVNESKTIQNKFASCTEEILEKMDEITVTDDAMSGDYFKLLMLKNELLKLLAKYEAIQLKIIGKLHMINREMLLEQDNIKKRLVFNIDEILKK